MVGAIAVYLFKRHLGRIEGSLTTIAEHTTHLAVLDTRLKVTEEDLRDMRAEMSTKLDRLLAGAGRP